MRQVVDFLSLLSVTEEQGGVRRMLGVCAEFERIARLVLDRSEKDVNSRRKRKSNRGSVSESPNSTPHFVHSQIPQKRATTQTPSRDSAPTPASVFAPDSNNNKLSAPPFDPLLNSFSSTPLPVSSNLSSVPLDFSTTSGPEFASVLSNAGITPNFQGSEGMTQQHFTGLTGPLFDSDSFQQPFVPQDLWQMPMTLEWDWADMTSIGYPSFTSNEQQQQQPLTGQGQM